MRAGQLCEVWAPEPCVKMGAGGLRRVSCGQGVAGGLGSRNGPCSGPVGATGGTLAALHNGKHMARVFTPLLILYLEEHA